MSSYHRGQPHPDLPAIPEGAEEATPVEEAEENDDVEDTLSVAESYANSYAFTLDNVGFDEESSLVGSVVGSVAGARLGEASVLHTPPAQTTPERISKHERRLHRETCRTLGLPYNEDTSIESSPSSRGDHSLGKEGSLQGIVVGESTDELERKRKIDKMWPWPTKAGSKESKELDETVRQSNASAEEEAEKTTLERVKEAVASFNERLEVAYDKAKEEKEGSNDNENNSSAPKSKRPRTLKEVLGQMRCVDKQHHDRNEEANPYLTKLTVGTTVLFMLLCIIVILATVAVSRQPSHPNLIDDAPEITTHHDLDELDNLGVPSVLPAEDDLVSAVVTTNPTLSPIAAPKSSPDTAGHSPPDIEVEVLDESCIDEEGKFQTNQGRKRKCEWLDMGELVSDRLDEECEASELGLHCRYACRAYNGCLQSQDETEDIALEKDGESEETAVMKVHPVPDDEVTPFPTASAIFAPSKSPSVAPVAATEPPTEYVPTFIDARGRERRCRWLDVRNLDQRQVRRDDNCIFTHVQLTCPVSCGDYLTMSVMNSEAVGHPGSFANADLGENVNSYGVVPVTSYVHYHDPLPQDDCFDNEGWYLNNHGVIQECSWLIDGHDPTDESRRYQNCGYPESEHTEATELGRMCKSTCGTCGL